MHFSERIKFYNLGLLVVVSLVAASCTSVPKSTQVSASEAMPADDTASKSALNALDKIFAAYSKNDISSVESLIDPEMIGRQQLLESMRTTLNSEKQIQIELRNTETITGKNIIVVRTGWDKRFLKVPNMAAAKVEGQTVFMMQFINNEWKLAAQSGDNIFSK